MAHLLLIDDDPALIREQREVFPAPAHRVDVANTGARGVESLRADCPDVIMLALRLPDQSGLEDFQQIREIDARIPVIFVTMSKGADAAIEAMKEGATTISSIRLPTHLRRWSGGDRSGASDARACPAGRPTDESDLSGDSILGICPAMQEVYKAIGRVAAQDVPVLITGESGTGKELVRGPSISMAALPGALPGPQLRRDPGDIPRERTLGA